jgi:hypothetical protein
VSPRLRSQQRVSGLHQSGAGVNCLRGRDTTMRPSCCSIVPVVRQSSARLQASGTGAGAGAGAGVGEPAEPDSEGKARLEGLPFRNHSNRPPPPLKLDSGRASGRCDSLFLRACPIRASQRSLDPHPSLSPPHTHTHLHLLPSRHAQPLCPRPDKTRPKLKDFLIPNGTRIHFSIILPDVLLPCPPSTRSTARLHYLQLERQRRPRRSVSQSLTSIFWRCLPCRTSPAPAAATCCYLLLCLPCPAHALPCHAMPLMMTDARRGASACASACACFLC